MTQTFTLTSKQQETLSISPHLIPVADLGDGDILALDQTPTHDEGSIYGPYVVTTEGKVQDVNYHYHCRHGMENIPLYFYNPPF